MSKEKPEYRYMIHVQQALNFAVNFANPGEPINAAHILLSILVYDFEEKSNAFDKIKSIVKLTNKNNDEAYKRPRPKAMKVDLGELDGDRFSEGIQRSFKIARSFWEGNEMVFGRELITLVLFSDDDSLKKLLKGDEHLSKVQLAWYNFLVASQALGRTKEYWDSWCEAAGFTFRKDYQHVPASKMPAAINVVELAAELARFLYNLKGDAAMLIGIFGRWGRGKTFLFNQIWRKLDSEEIYNSHFYRVDFHAWKHQETQASWGYLYEEIAAKYYKQSNGWLGRQLKILKLNWNRGLRIELTFFIVGLVSAFSFLTFSAIMSLLQNGKQLSASEKAGEGQSFNWWFISIPYTLIVSLSGSKMMQLLKSHSSEARKIYQKYSKKHSFKSLLGTQAEVQKELKTLLETWIKETSREEEAGDVNLKNRILLFVDDVDRCSEDRIIQVVDALRVMLEDEAIAKRLVVVVAVDERILRRAIHYKYDKLLSGIEHSEKVEKLGQLTREYLDKLFIAGIKLGDLNDDERASIFDALTKEKVDKNLIDQEIQVNQAILDDDFDNPEQNPEITVAESSINEGIKVSIEIAEEQGARESDYEILPWEYRELKKVIGKIDHITPRQIRIFYLRYLLARDYFMLFKGRASWIREQCKALACSLRFLHNKNLFEEGSIAHELESEEFLTQCVHLKENPVERKHFIEILQIVVPY